MRGCWAKKSNFKNQISRKRARIWGCDFSGAVEDGGVKDLRKVRDVVFGGIDFE